MFKKIKINNFLVILIFSSLLNNKIYSFNLSREYLSTVEFFPEFTKTVFLNTNLFLSSSQNLNDERVVDPWVSYKLVNFNYHLQKYNANLNQPAKNYLTKYRLDTILRTTPDQLIIDTLIDRTTIGQDFKTGFVISKIFDNHDFSKWAGTKAEINKKRFSGIDLYCDATISLLNINTSAEYELSPNSYSGLVDSMDEDFLINKNFSKNGVLNDIEEARRNLQDSLNINAYHANQTGPSDLNLTIGLKKNFKYLFNCNRLELFGAVNVSFPTGVKKDIDNVLSFNFGKEKISCGLIGGLNILLKRDVAAGVCFVHDFGYLKETLERVSINEEPSSLSPKKDMVLTKVNGTSSISSYILFKNLIVDKIDFRLKYLNVSHDNDSLYALNPLETKSKSLRNLNNYGHPFMDNSTVGQTETRTSFNYSRIDFRFTWNPGSVKDRDDEKYSMYLDIYYPLSNTRSLASRGIGFGGSIRF